MLFGALLEIILLTILVGGGIFGYRKGLFRFVASPFRAIACLALAFWTCGEVGDLIFSPLIAPAMENYLAELLGEGLNIAQDVDFENLPTVLKIILAASFFEGKGDINISTAEIVDIVARPLSGILSRIIAFVILFTLAAIISRLIIHLVNFVLDRGILGKINSILGVLLSGAISILIAWGFVSLFDCIIHLDFLGRITLLDDFVGGPIYRLFRESSLLQLLLSF